MYLLKKILFSIAFLSIAFSASSQSIIIDYEFEVNDPQSSSRNFTSRYKLYDNINYSLYVLNNTNYYQDTSSIQVEQNDGYEIKRLSDERMVIESSNKATAFINRTENKLFCRQMIATRTLIVEEDIPLMDWTLTDKDTVYLNFPCKIATTEFRGRSWTAFFTDSLGFNAAPWKLYGLPGILLYAITTDNLFTFRATGIILHKNTIEINNPYQNINEKYSWKEYKKEYKNFNRKYVKSMNASMPGANITLESKSGLEDVDFD